MIVTLIAAMLAAQPEPVQLWRVFTKGESFTYDVKSHLLFEEQQLGRPVFMPSELDLNYVSTQKVVNLKNDGMAEIHYERPTMTEIKGETAESPPVSTVEKVNFDMMLTVSQINEFLNQKDLTKDKAKDKEKKGTGKGDAKSFFTYPSSNKRQIRSVISTFVGEIVRLSLYVGSMDVALEFNPKLPVNPVVPGDTWKKTVGFQPQKLKGKDGKLAVQRLDYEFKYGGIVEVDGKKVHRVTASLHLDTDAGAFLNQMMGTKPEESGLKAIPLKLDSTIEFDLDLNTRKTLKAKASSKGGMSIQLVELGDESVQELRLTGNTVMKLKPNK